MGLFHDGTWDGTNSVTYYAGQGDWAPIMGWWDGWLGLLRACGLQHCALPGPCDFAYAPAAQSHAARQPAIAQSCAPFACACPGASYYKSVTQWSAGAYPNANNNQDDFEVMEVGW